MKVWERVNWLMILPPLDFVFSPCKFVGRTIVHIYMRNCQLRLPTDDFPCGVKQFCMGINTR